MYSHIVQINARGDSEEEKKKRESNLESTVKTHMQTYVGLNQEYALGIYEEHYQGYNPKAIRHIL